MTEAAAVISVRELALRAGNRRLLRPSSFDLLEGERVLLVDDMDLTRNDDPELRKALQGVRAELLAAASLHTVELAFSSGVMLSVRRHGKVEKFAR